MTDRLEHQPPLCLRDTLPRQLGLLKPPGLRLMEYTLSVTPKMTTVTAVYFVPLSMRLDKDATTIEKRYRLVEIEPEEGP